MGTVGSWSGGDTAGEVEAEGRGVEPNEGSTTSAYVQLKAEQSGRLLTVIPCTSDPSHAQELSHLSKVKSRHAEQMSKLLADIEGK